MGGPNKISQNRKHTKKNKTALEKNPIWPKMRKGYLRITKPFLFNLVKFISFRKFPVKAGINCVMVAKVNAIANNDKPTLPIVDSFQHIGKHEPCVWKELPGSIGCSSKNKVTI